MVGTYIVAISTHSGSESIILTRLIDWWEIHFLQFLEIYIFVGMDLYKAPWYFLGPTYWLIPPSFKVKVLDKTNELLNLYSGNK